MEILLNIDWKSVFVPTVSVLEIMFRGSVIYLVLFGLIRFGLKREAGTLGITDLLVVVLVADAAQSAMAMGVARATSMAFITPLGPVIRSMFW